MAASGVSSFPSLSPNALSTMPGSFQLNGHNYLEWARLVEVTLEGFEVLSHIKGNAPPKTDPYFQIWEVEDALIISWLLLSMTPKIGFNCRFFSTAREIWENLAETYSVKKDHIVRYEIESKLFKTKQGSLSVTEYYKSLNVLWDELDRLENLKMNCSADRAAFAEFIEQERLFRFLWGLNSQYDRVKVQILSKEKLPPIIEVFYIVRDEETSRLKDDSYN